MQNVRIVFEKTGQARYMSHLDLVRTMTRAVRRAHIPLWYTEGFNRHPYLTFAAPLSLGYEGLHETMDLRLEEPMPMDELVAQLNAVLPTGLRAVEANECVCKAGDLASAAYTLTFACPADTLQTLLAQPAITVEKRTKKGGFKTVDIKEAVANAAVTPTEDGGCAVAVTLPNGSNNNVNPQLLLTALQQFVGDDTLTMRVLRRELYAESGVPFR